MVIVVNSSAFGEKLRSIRLKQRLSQKALARQCGISVYRLRRIEQGYIVDIEDAVMQALCAALGKRLEELLY